MKKVISIVLAIMMMIMVAPFSAFAMSDKYTDVDYSKTLTVGTAFTGTIDATDPYISTPSWSGYAKGFTINLTAGKTYKAVVTVSDDNADFIDRKIAVLSSTLTEEFYNDVVASSDGVDSTNTFVSCSCTFIATQTGSYKVLVWGFCEDSSNNDLTGGKTTVLVAEPSTKTLDISTTQDLVDAYTTITTGTDDYVLNFLADIDMSSIDWTPIYVAGGIEVKGNNHTITGLNNPLFGTVSVLKASDLAFEDFHYTSSTGASAVGALAGCSYQGVVSNCSASGSIDISGGDSDTIGGLIGVIEEDVSIKDCSADVDITIDCDGGCYVDCIGGLIGLADCNNFFENCNTKGSITINNIEKSVYSVGGFAGYFEDYEACNNCSADVDIQINTKGTSAEIECIGGFTGYIDEACGFFNCYSKGSINIEGANNYAVYIGGFNGYSLCCGGTECVNCYSITDVKGGQECVGSFFGSSYENETFKNCYSAGSVTFVNTDGSEDGPYNGLFIGGAAYPDEVTCENCFVKKDDDAPVIVDSYGNAINQFDGITEVDFSNKDAIDAMTSALNDKCDDYLDECNDYMNGMGFGQIEKLFSWGKINEKGGPIFSNRTVRFLDENGNEILVLTDLFDGEDISAKAPAVPTKEGFTGKWDTDFIVDGDMDIYPIYEKDGDNEDPGEDQPKNNNNNNKKDEPKSPNTGNEDLIIMILGVAFAVNMFAFAKTRTRKEK